MKILTRTCVTSMGVLRPTVVIDLVQAQRWGTSIVLSNKKVLSFQIYISFFSLLRVFITVPFVRQEILIGEKIPINANNYNILTAPNLTQAQVRYQCVLVLY